MAANDSLDNRQSYAGTLELVGRMQTLKHAKKPVGIAHVESDTIVLDIVLQPASHFAAKLVADLNESGLPAARKFQRIAQDIREHLPKQNWISRTRGQFTDRNHNVLAGSLRQQFGEHLAYELRNDHALLAQRLKT